MNVLITLNLPENAAGAAQDGVEKIMTHVHQPLDPLDNVTPALLDGLDQSVMPVKGSDSVQRVTAPTVSRMVSGSGSGFGHLVSCMV